jgi:hypothetical protein
MDALKLETENQSVVIRSIKQTVAKFVDQIDILTEELSKTLSILIKQKKVMFTRISKIRR